MKKSVIACCMALMALPACARTFSFATSVPTVGDSNNPGSSVPVDAEATFRVSAGSMYVTLVNLEQNTYSVGQDISSILFTINNGSSILSLSSGNLAASSGNEVTVLSSGAVSEPVATSLTHWAAGSDSSSGPSYLTDFTGQQMPQTIIGPATSGNYATVNGSIGGNSPHNPFIQQQASFTIKDAGILSTATVSDVTIGFGTTSNGATSANTAKTLPEPGSFALIGIGLLSVFFRRSKG